MRRKRNGRYRHSASVNTRTRIMRYARSRGHITNKQAIKISKLEQPWYHLNKLVEAGYLKRIERNRWTPVKFRGRPADVRI
jgi:hypothetical protein